MAAFLIHQRARAPHGHFAPLCPDATPPPKHHIQHYAGAGLPQGHRYATVRHSSRLKTSGLVGQQAAQLTASPSHRTPFHSTPDPCPHTWRGSRWPPRCLRSERAACCSAHDHQTGQLRHTAEGRQGPKPQLQHAGAHGHVQRSCEACARANTWRCTPRWGGGAPCPPQHGILPGDLSD